MQVNEIQSKYSHKKIFAYLVLILTLTSAGLYYGLRDAGNIFSILSLIKIDTLFILAGILSVYILFESLQLWLLVRLFKKDYKYSQAIKLRVIGRFFSAITPMASGGQFAQLFVLSKQGVKKTEGTAILLINFIIIQISTVLITGILFATRFSTYIEFMDVDWLIGAAVLGFTITSAILIALLLGAFSEKFQMFAVKLFMFIYKVIGKGEEKQKNKKEKLTKSFTDVRAAGHKILKHKKVIFAAMLLYSATSFTNASIAFFAGRDLGIAYEFAELYDISTLTMFVITINNMLPSPGGAGTAEYFYQTVYQGYVQGRHGWNAIYSNAVAGQMVVWRTVTFTIPLFIGMATYFISTDGVRKKK